MQEMGFDMTREMVANVVMDYLKDKGQVNPFTRDRPGKAWWAGFLKRWPDLTEWKPTHMPANRATAVTEASVTNWFSKVSTTLVEGCLSNRERDDIGRQLWNCDETTFATDVASQRILARRGRMMYMRLVVVPVGSTSQFQGVDQRMESVSHPTRDKTSE